MCSEYLDCASFVPDTNFAELGICRLPARPATLPLKDVLVHRMQAQPKQIVEPKAMQRTFSVPKFALCGVLTTLLVVSAASAQPPAKGKSNQNQPDVAKKKVKTPPRKPVKGLPEMEITKELITEREYESLGQKLDTQKIFRILAAGNRNQKAIEDWARWRVYGMTLKSKRVNPKKQNELSDMREQLMRDLRNCARNLVKNNRPAAQAFRTIVCREVTNHCADLMDNNYYVRLQAILILSNMNLMDYDAITRTPPIAYGPAADVLMDKVIKKPQHVSLKIAAVNGLRRIATLAKFDAERNRKMAALLVSEFKNRESHPWYLQRLATTLGRIDLPVNAQNQPIIAQALMEAVADESKPPIVRSRSARAIGRAAMPETINADVIAYELVSLARHIAQSYNRDVPPYLTKLKRYNAKEFQRKQQLEKQGEKFLYDSKNAPKMPQYWPAAALDVYLAFRPENDIEEKLLGLRRRGFDRRVGLLKKFPKNAAINGAYKVIRPITSHLLKQVRAGAPAVVPDAEIDRLTKWLADTANKPKSFQLQPGAKPIRTMKTPVTATDPNRTSSTSSTAP